MAGGWQPFGGTTPLRAKRVLKGKGLIRKKGKTAGVPLLVRSAAAQAAPRPVGSGHTFRPVGRIRKNGAPSRGTRRNGAPRSSRPTEDAAAQAAFPPAMRGHRRCAFQGKYPCPWEWPPAAPHRCSPLRGPLRQRLTALPPPLKGEAGRVVQMASVGCAQARDSSLRAAPSAQNDRGTEAGWVVQTAVVVTRGHGPLRSAQDGRRDCRNTGEKVLTALQGGRCPPHRLTNPDRVVY